MTDRLAAFTKYHLQPLTLVEIAALVAALLIGWKLIALAILVEHVARMGITALRARKEQPRAEAGLASR